MYLHSSIDKNVVDPGGRNAVFVFHEMGTIHNNLSELKKKEISGVINNEVKCMKYKLWCQHSILKRKGKVIFSPSRNRGLPRIPG